MYKRFVHYGLEHWGSDQQGVNTTRRSLCLSGNIYVPMQHHSRFEFGRFLLEWLSFTHRYVPVGIIATDRMPQRITQKPPPYVSEWRSVYRAPQPVYCIHFCLCQHGRGDLETLLSSSNCSDWIEISKILLGPLPEVIQIMIKC